VEKNLGENVNFISSIELSPDSQELAIGLQGGSILIWNLAQDKVERRIENGLFKWGAYLKYSRDGKFLLLQEQYFTDWSLNKDRTSSAAILELQSGKIILNVGNVHASVISPDSKQLVTLEKNTINFRNIESGIIEKSFSNERITNAFSLNPDGNLLL
jgi:WD40 repeat protein